jgi:hypothetical protein
MKYEVAARSERGSKSTICPTAAYTAGENVNNTAVVFAMVAEGLSGSSLPDYAASSVTEVAEKWFRSVIKAVTADPAAFPVSGSKMFAKVNELMDQELKGWRDKGQGSPAVQASLIILHDEKYLVTCIGKSRMYLYRDGKLYNSPHDGDEAALGRDTGQKIQYFDGQIQKNDVFMIATSEFAETAYDSLEFYLSGNEKAEELLQKLLVRRREDSDYPPAAAAIIHVSEYMQTEKGPEDR